MAIHSLNGETTGGDINKLPLNSGSTWVNPVAENNDTKPGILIGFQEGGFGDRNYGIKVAQEGYDVRTAAEANLIMSSQFNTFKIAASGGGYISSADPDWVDSGAGSLRYFNLVYIEHGVDVYNPFADPDSFKPIVLVFGGPAGPSGAPFIGGQLPNLQVTNSGTLTASQWIDLVYGSGFDITFYSANPSDWWYYYYVFLETV